MAAQVQQPVPVKVDVKANDKNGTKPTTTSKNYQFQVITPPKVTVIHRSLAIPLSALNLPVEEESATRRSINLYSEPTLPPVQPGEVKHVVDDICHDPEERNREKTEINDLNDRLEKLLKSTRDAESANREAAIKLKAVRDNLGKDTRDIKEKYDHVLREMKNRLEDAENKRGELEIKLVSLQSELDDLRGKIDEVIQRQATDKDLLEKNTQRLSELKNESALLERKLAQLETEREKLKAENAKLLEELHKKRTDLDQESITRIKAENRAYCLQEELDFLRRIWDQERKELEKLTMHDSSNQNREILRTEITTLQRELQQEFDTQLGRLRDALASSYDIKLQELTILQNKPDELPNIREEVKRSRAAHAQLQSQREKLEPKVQDYERQLQDLRDGYEQKLSELEQQLLEARRSRDNSQNYIQMLIDELRRLMELKVSLENEITLYRKLLEEEEKKINELVGPEESNKKIVLTSNSGEQVGPAAPKA